MDPDTVVKLINLRMQNASCATANVMYPNVSPVVLKFVYDIGETRIEDALRYWAARAYLSNIQRYNIEYSSEQLSSAMGDTTDCKLTHVAACSRYGVPYTVGLKAAPGLVSFNL